MQDSTPGAHRSPFAAWGKALLVVAVAEMLLFHAKLFWHAQPDFYEDNQSKTDNWHHVFQTARTIETRRSSTPAVVVIGSSVLDSGLDEVRAKAALREKGIPVDILPFISLGSTATDAALVAWQARAIRPWLVVYTAALRDFCKFNIVDSSVKRIFYDSSAQLPLWPREGVESHLSASLKSYWKLYRYRFFARRTVTGWLKKGIRALTLPSPTGGEAPAVIPDPTAVEAFRYFAPLFIDPEGWIAWKEWRRTRRFEDFIRFLELRGANLPLALYKIQTLAACGPEGNPHARALEWMLDRLRAEEIRTVILYSPENPVFFDRAAMQMYDFGLALAYLRFFTDTTQARGALFENWRTTLEGEDFYDMIHVNLVGREKFTDRFVALIEREWRASEASKQQEERQNARN